MSASATSKQNKPEEVEMSTIKSKDTGAAASADNHESASLKKESPTDLNPRKTNVTSNTSGEIEEDKAKNGANKEDDKADGYDPFSQESFRPLMSGNQYSVRKTASQALIDVALMMANISQLRTLLTAGDAMEYSAILIALVGMSLAFQVIFAILIFIIWMRETDLHQQDDYLNTLREITKTSDASVATIKDKLRNSLLQRQKSFQSHKLTAHLNYATMVLVFIITIINMFITGFGIKLEAATNPTPAATTS